MSVMAVASPSCSLWVGQWPGSKCLDGPLVLLLLWLAEIGSHESDYCWYVSLPGDFKPEEWLAAPRHRLLFSDAANATDSRLETFQGCFVHLSNGQVDADDAASCLNRMDTAFTVEEPCCPSGF